MTDPLHPHHSGAKILLPEQLDSLAQANHLVARKQYTAAARLFAMLAVELEYSQHPHQAANLHALAALTFAEAYAIADLAHAAELAGQTLTQARTALRLLVDANRNERTRRFYSAIMRRLQDLEMNPAIMALKTEFGRYGTTPLSLVTSNTQQRVGLPQACTTCASPLRADDVIWRDARTAECAYCGEPVHLDG